MKKLTFEQLKTLECGYCQTTVLNNGYVSTDFHFLLRRKIANESSIANRKIIFLFFYFEFYLNFDRCNCFLLYTSIRSATHLCFTSKHHYYIILQNSRLLRVSKCC